MSDSKNNRTPPHFVGCTICKTSRVLLRVAISDDSHNLLHVRSAQDAGPSRVAATAPRAGALVTARQEQDLFFLRGFLPVVIKKAKTQEGSGTQKTGEVR